MHIVCPKEILNENINIVSKAVSNKSTMQILECILITADEGGVKMTANDLEMGIETEYFGADVIRDGSIALDARFFSEIIRKMPDGDIGIDADSNNVTVISCGQAELKILGLGGDEFPMMPEFERSEGVAVDSYKFKNMIRQTSFSISQDSSKPVFTGGLIEVKDGCMNMVTVDGFRISFRREEAEARPGTGDIKVIVPGRTLNEISKILSSEEEERLTLYFTDKHVLFEQKGFTLLSRLIEGDFLRYEQNFSNDYTSLVKIDRAEFGLALERTMLIARDSVKNPVEIKIENDKLIITSNTEAGAARDEIPIDLTGENLQISFNPRYLYDALRAVDDEKIEMLFNTRLSPCIIRSSSGSTDYKYLILPLRSWN